MTSLADQFYAQARIIPVRNENKIASVTKMECGSLKVVTRSGHSYEISQANPEFQVFAIYSVLIEA